LPKGYVALVLHAHLPYVRHPEHEDFHEERWLFEAISETYIPLISVFRRLMEEGSGFKLTLSLTPPLLSMLNDPLLQERYIKYLQKLILLTEKEMERTSGQPDLYHLAEMYRMKYESDLRIFRDRYQCNLISAFKEFSRRGNLELMTCPATHGLLPLMNVTPGSIRAQILIGAETHARLLGSQPRGIWLPECGYSPEIEGFLKEAGIRYFITETHGVLYANPRPVFGTYSPIVTRNGLVVFGRDMESSRQVWSAAEGYPGDPDYRDFYRDIGYDLEYDYVRDFISSEGNRTYTGIKYYRITGRTDQKEPYDPGRAAAKAGLHADDFKKKRERQIEYAADFMNRPPLIVCPYDAELFGHWWHEGPQWIYALMNRVSRDSSILGFTTLGEYVDQYPVMQIASPCPSTWGSKGYNEVWLNHSNDWIYRHLHKASRRMSELADRFGEAEDIRKAALNQAARELLLAQSSDWAFIMKTGTLSRYAEMRTRDHISHFNRLYHDILADTIDCRWLKELESRDNIFPDLDYRVYGSRNSHAV